jgi:hypothetical protein
LYEACKPISAPRQRASGVADQLKLQAVSGEGSLIWHNWSGLSELLSDVFKLVIPTNVAFERIHDNENRRKAQLRLS